jgi:hypothetical protein
VSCSRPLDQAWTICPYCETEVPGAGASRRPRRRRAVAESEALAIESDGLEGARSTTKSSEDWLGDTAASGGGAALVDDGEDLGSAAGSVAASKPTSRSRSAGRASRPRPTS